MVFRGKPSKACQRCRERKLRCDLQRPTCSSCLRVGVHCYGYRETDALRIADQTQTVRSKALCKRDHLSSKRAELTFKLSHLPLDLQVQARELFFAYYIADFSRAWDFLYPYFDPRGAPDHLTLSIDAVSLAFLSHHIASPSAQNLGRRKYVSALRKTNSVLQSTAAAKEATTLEASLLLDLFEKISNPASVTVESQRAHVDGALTLVKLRGLEHFTDDAGLRALTRLSLNGLVCCMSEGLPIPKELREIREHTATFIDTRDPKWGLTGVILETSDLVAEITKGVMTPQERVRRCTELDKQLEQISEDAPPVWSYERIYVRGDEHKDRVLDGFYDVYNARMVTQMWNVLRLTRILLCEEVVESSLAVEDKDLCVDSRRASAAITSTVFEICASVPQMTDCEGAARQKLPPGSLLCAGSSHSHTLSHFLDTYILIFALYVACWSSSCPHNARRWVIRQLKRIAEHFGVKEAAVVVDILQKQDTTARVGPWDVYRLLGSYAFAA